MLCGQNYRVLNGIDRGAMAVILIGGKGQKK